MRIGVFDSGIGGMTVLKELIQSFPNSQYVYLGDTANVPYGTKSEKKIKELCQQATLQLKDKNINLLIVACNTASSLALDIIQENMGDIPVIGMVEPGIEAILQKFYQLPSEPKRRILILGTKATINSRIYSREVRKHIIFNEISEQACQLVVPMIEEGWAKHRLMEEVVNEYVQGYKNDSVPGIALLACTHYPWAQDVFEKCLPGWSIINSAKSVADFVKKQNFIKSDLLTEKFSVEWIFTDPKAVTEMAVNDFRDSLGIIIET